MTNMLLLRICMRRLVCQLISKCVFWIYFSSNIELFETPLRVFFPLPPKPIPPNVSKCLVYNVLYICILFGRLATFIRVPLLTLIIDEIRVIYLSGNNFKSDNLFLRNTLILEISLFFASKYT